MGGFGRPAEGGNHRRAPRPLAPRHGPGDGQRVGARRWGQGGEQRPGGAKQGRRLVRVALRNGQVQGAGEAARRRDAKPRRAREGEKFEHVEGREPRRAQTSGRGPRMAHDGPGASFDAPGGLGQGQALDLAIGRYPRRAADAGHQDRRPGHSHGDWISVGNRHGREYRGGIPFSHTVMLVAMTMLYSLSSFC